MAPGDAALHRLVEAFDERADMRRAWGLRWRRRRFRLRLLQRLAAQLPCLLVEGVLDLLEDVACEGGIYGRRLVRRVGFGRRREFRLEFSGPLLLNQRLHLGAFRQGDAVIRAELECPS